MGILEQILIQLQEINQKLGNLETGSKQQKVYDVTEAAELLTISEDKMYKLIRNNEIEHIKIGRRRVVTREQLENYIAGNAEEKKEKTAFKNNIRFLSNS